MQSGGSQLGQCGLPGDIGQCSETCLVDLGRGFCWLLVIVGRGQRWDWRGDVRPWDLSHPMAVTVLLPKTLW